MKIIVYDYGNPREIEVKQHNCAVVEITLEDKRQVQFSITDNGELYIRGWGTTPADVGNMHNFTLLTQIIKQEKSV